MSQQKDVDKCYTLEDNAEALECMKDIVRESSGKCKPQLVLFTEEGCTPCEEEKTIHKDAIKEGIIKELSVNTEEGLKVAIDIELDYLPALVMLDCNNKIIQPTETV